MESGRDWAWVTELRNTPLLVSSVTSTELWAGKKFSTVPKTPVWLLLTWCLSLRSCTAPAGYNHVLLFDGSEPCCPRCHRRNRYTAQTTFFVLPRHGVSQQHWPSPWGNPKASSTNHKTLLTALETKSAIHLIRAPRLLYLLRQETASFS